jgi:hypothetical protein
MIKCKYKNIRPKIPNENKNEKYTESIYPKPLILSKLLVKFLTSNIGPKRIFNKLSFKNSNLIVSEKCESLPDVNKSNNKYLSSGKMR